MYLEHLFDESKIIFVDVKNLILYVGYLYNSTCPLVYGSYPWCHYFLASSLALPFIFPWCGFHHDKLNNVL
jgi:hypothetical protein